MSFLNCTLGLLLGALAGTTPASVVPAVRGGVIATTHGAMVEVRTNGRPPAGPLVFTDVTLIDITNGRRIPGQTIVVVKNRIRTIGPMRRVRIPAGARVINAHGTYVIPGLWDMHAHVDDSVNFLYPRFIAHGVTGLREMAQRFPGGADSFRIWQREVAAGTRIGPRVFGPSADNVYLNMTGVSMQTPDAIRHAIDSLKAAGFVFLKQHRDRMPRELYFATAAEARRVGLPFEGHIPVDVTEVEASDSGQKSVEHVEENHHCWPNWPEPLDSLAEQRCAPVAAAYVRNGTWMVPTLVGANYYPEHNVPVAQHFVHMMHHFGVRMLAGTDFGMDMMDEQPQFLPGVSAVTEVVYLAGAGLTPLEALQAGTLNPAIFFNATDSLGTVAPGKLADFVLLDGDPLRDILNVRRLRAVVANGRYFDRAQLDTLDPSPRPTPNVEPVLTEDAVTRMMTFWTRFKQEPDPVPTHGNRVPLDLITLLPGLQSMQLRAVNMVVMAGRFPAVAADLAQAGLTAEQWQGYRLALADASGILQGLGTVSQLPAGSVLAQNVAFLRAHPKEFNAVVAAGMWSPAVPQP